MFWFLSHFFMTFHWEISLPHLISDCNDLSYADKDAITDDIFGSFCSLTISEQMSFRHLKSPAASRGVAGTVVTTTSGALSAGSFWLLQATVRGRTHLRAWTLWDQGHSQAAPLISRWGGRVKVSCILDLIVYFYFLVYWEKTGSGRE